jgi:topoisomerase (DNA) II binding protein 1
MGGSHTDDPKHFTHLLSSKPNRSEKFLTAVAKGKFILHVSYIEKCAEKGRFLREDEFEFGNPLSSLVKVEAKDQKLLKAPYNWRQWINFQHKERFKDGAFTGFNCIFALEQSEKIAQLMNVIFASGGKEAQDLDYKSTLRTAQLKRQKVNIYLTQKSGAITEENMKTLKACNVKCVNVLYINDYLMSENVPDPI